MFLLQLFIALFLPWLPGIAWLRIGWHKTSPGSWPLVLGYGYPLGMLMTTLIMSLWDVIGLKQAFWPIAGVLFLLALLGAWCSRSTPWKESGLAGEKTAHSQNHWQKALLGLLIAILGIRYASLGLEILWRPLYPWDAWTTWAPRAQVWFNLKELVPFVDSAYWLHHPGQEVYTLPAWQYPKAISLIQLWIALALERWDDSLINLPWLLCTIALGFAFYGQLRRWGLAPLASLLGIYLLLSIPLLNTHTALAGYADLWLATVYSMAGMAFLQWLRTGDPWQGGVALLFALACPLIKREGLIWMLTFLPPLFVARLSFKRILLVGAGGITGLIAWYSAGGISLGELQITPEVIQIPSVGRFELGLHPVWESFYQNLFVMGNWNLFWYFAVVVSIFTAFRTLIYRESLIYALFIGSGLIILLFTFFFTSNAAWAERYTSINRVLLHWVPLLLFYMLLLFKPDPQPAKP